MKKKYFCKACGTRELTDLYITTSKGKMVSLHLSSQADIRKSSGDVCCMVCKSVWQIQPSQATSIDYSADNSGGSTQMH